MNREILLLLLVYCLLHKLLRYGCSRCRSCVGTICIHHVNGEHFVSLIVVVVPVITSVVGVVVVDGSGDVVPRSSSSHVDVYSARLRKAQLVKTLAGCPSFSRNRFL